MNTGGMGERAPMPHFRILQEKRASPFRVPKRRGGFFVTFDGLLGIGLWTLGLTLGLWRIGTARGGYWLWSGDGDGRSLVRR